MTVYATKWKCAGPCQATDSERAQISTTGQGVLQAVYSSEYQRKTCDNKCTFSEKKKKKFIKEFYCTNGARLATGWMVWGNPGTDKNFIFWKVSRMAQGPTQLPIQWVPRFFLGGKVAGVNYHFQSLPRLIMTAAIYLSPSWHEHEQGKIYLLTLNTNILDRM